MVGAAAMAWYGAQSRFFVDASLLYFALYWGAFLFLIIAALFTVMLDIRYILLQHKLGEREIFQQTLGDEAFRRGLIAAQQEERDAAKQDLR